MVFRRGLCFFLASTFGLLAQTAPPKPAAPPQPTVTMGVDTSKPRPTVPPDHIVLSVGDVQLTAAQFDLLVDALPEQYRASAHGLGRKAFADQLVRILVLAQEGKRRKLDAAPAYQMQNMLQSANLLAGLTLEQIGKGIKLGDPELKTYYEKHQSDFEEVHASQIVVRMQGSPIPVKPGQKDLTDAEALAKAQEIRKKLEEGVDFGTLALAESDDSATVSKGGDLGTFRRGHLVPAAEEALFALKPGEISQPVKSMLGYHVLKLESKSVAKTFEQAKAEIEGKLRPEMTRTALDDLQRTELVHWDPDFFGLAK